MSNLDQQLQRCQAQIERLRSMPDSEFVETVARWERDNDDILSLVKMDAFIERQLAMRILAKLCRVHDAK